MSFAMEHAARRFARRVLIIHLLALLVIGVLVVFAARAVYHASREQALEQAQKRQELLAIQTSRGIESYYRSILDNLDLQRRAEEDDDTTWPTTEPPQRREPQRPDAKRPHMAQEMIGKIMWEQLRGRASHFFAIERRTMTIVRQYNEERSSRAGEIVEAADPWLREITTPQISDTYKINNELVNLVAVPIRSPSRLTLVAVVPLENVQRLFLADVNSIRLMSAWLVDDDGDVMISFDDRLVGLNIKNGTPELQALSTKYLQTDKAGTEVIERPLPMGPLVLDSAMLTIRPIAVPGNHWLLGIASSLNEVNAVVARTFRRALWWAIFVIVSLTALLTSTSIFMIRSRLRLERMRRELLTRELDQAREIQLAWLPDPTRCRVAIDVAAVNQPASHISGDFYNWFELPGGRTAVLIGDVTGHGMAAAFLMATAQLLVRAAMTATAHAGDCLSEVNRQLCMQGFSGQFVTMLLLVIETDQQTVHAVSAGHPPPLIGDGATFRAMDLESQLVLGVESDIAYQSQTFHLPPHASVVLYTDGVPDLLSADGERFKLQRLIESLDPTSEHAKILLLQALVALEQFKADRPLADDLTLVTIQLAPTGVRSSAIRMAAAG